MWIVVERRIFQGLERGRNVAERLGELRLGAGVGREVLQEQPRLGRVRRVARDPDHVPADLPGAVQLGMRRGDRERRGRVGNLRLVARDESGSPLAVQAHRDLTRLESLRRRPLRVRSAQGGDEVLELGIPLCSIHLRDEVLLPGQETRPTGVGAERRLAVRVVPLPAAVDAVVKGPRFVERTERHEPGHLDRSIGVELRQRFRVDREFVEGLGRRGDVGLLEHRGVVVEAVGIRENRQRALVPLVAGVSKGRLRDDLRDIHPVLLEERGEVLVRLAVTELRDIVRPRADREIRGGPRVDRPKQILVRLSRRVRDGDPRILRLEVGEDACVLVELSPGVEAPEVQRDRRVLHTGRGIDGTHRARSATGRARGRRHTERHHRDHHPLVHDTPFDQLDRSLPSSASARIRARDASSSVPGRTCEKPALRRFKRQGDGAVKFGVCAQRGYLDPGTERRKGAEFPLYGP